MIWVTIWYKYHVETGVRTWNCVFPRGIMDNIYCFVVVLVDIEIYHGNFKMCFILYVAKPLKINLL